MNKKSQLFEVFGFALVFSFVSIICIFLAILNYGITNDYIIYNMQNLTEELNEDGIVNNKTVNYLQARADEYRNFNFHIDDIWFFLYLAFIISSFVVAYQTKPINYFGWLSILFYGIMFLLFVLTIFQTLTNWFNTEILVKIIPDAIILLPKFYYYVDHIGVFTAIQIVICLVINLVDFNFASIFAKKKQEQQALEDEEVV